LGGGRKIGKAKEKAVLLLCTGNYRNQGDQRERLMAVLEGMEFKVKRVGG
jgi:translation initiation factor 1 (eIF-1/SUI1)